MGDKKEDRILGSLYNLFYKFQILDEKKFKRYQSGKLIASEQDKIQFIEDIIQKESLAQVCNASRLISIITRRKVKRW